MSRGQLSIFLKKDTETFSENLHEAIESKGPKTDRANLFLNFEKFLFWGKRLKFPPKQGFLYFC